MGIASGYISSKASKKAAKIQSDSASEGIEAQREQFNQILELLGPSIEGGDLAREQQLGMLGLRGPEAQAAAMKSFSESPSQKFIRERQQRALLRNSAAIGGLGGGNIRTALQEQAAGFASQDFNNAFNRLSSISGAGQAAAGNIGQFGQQSVGNISNLLQQSGQAQAAGHFGTAEAATNASNTFMQGLGTYLKFSDSRLKKNLNKIGKIGVLNVYEWIWKDTGLSDTGFIAQEVKESFPDLVSKVGDYLAVDYNKVLEAV